MDLFHQALARCGTAFSLIALRLIARQNPSPELMQQHKKISPETVTEEIDFTDIIEELGNYSYHSGLPAD